MSIKKSPYLSSDNRLGDVIAAIQVMATYKFYKLDFESWSDRICGDKRQSDYWRQIFEEHPEFFRLDSCRKKASLVWRRQHPKLYNVDIEAKISRDEFRRLSPEGVARMSRMPLTSQELGTLIDTAINLHSRSLARNEDRRWWIPALSALLGAVLGGILPALATVLAAAPP